MLTAYHGSERDFTEFKLGLPYDGSTGKAAALYFSTSRNNAISYMQPGKTGYLYEVELDLGKTLRIDAKGHLWKTVCSPGFGPVVWYEAGCAGVLVYDTCHALSRADLLKKLKVRGNKKDGYRVSYKAVAGSKRSNALYFDYPIQQAPVDLGKCKWEAMTFATRSEAEALIESIISDRELLKFFKQPSLGPCRKSNLSMNDLGEWLADNNEYDSIVVDNVVDSGFGGQVPPATTIIVKSPEHVRIINNEQY